MKNWNFFVKAAVIAFLIFGVVTTVQLGSQISELEGKVAVSEKQRDSLQAEVEELLDEIEQPVDAEYIKKIAREALNYHLPKEIVFYNDIAR